MRMLDSMTTLPEGWSLERVGDWHALARYRTSEGSINLACYELVEGMILTDIDLACPTLPAFNPMGPRVATVNWCASGRCEVDFGASGSLVVGKDTLCVSSAVATTFAYPTGRYRGFELFVDVDSVTASVWQALEACRLTRQRLEEALVFDGLGMSLAPCNELAEAVRSLESELSRELPRQGWLVLGVFGLLLALSECDLDSAEVAGTYLRRSQRDLAQAVYQHLVADFSPAANLGGLAARLGVSEATLRGYFERVYGQSPSAFARTRVLSEAARLLASTDRPIADVAQTCGYANPSKFSAAFRRAYDTNPLEYRRRSRLA